MKIKTMNELYVEELRDLYSAETQIIIALPKVIEGVESKKLSDAIGAHLEQTKDQLERLEAIFRDLEETPTGNKCEATEGLLREASGVFEDVEKGFVRDAAIIGAAQRLEHYEISAYGTARTFAELLGFEKHAGLLQETLEEEQATDLKLNEIAYSEVNIRAIKLERKSQFGKSKK